LKLAPFADELQVIFIVLDLVLGFVERADKNGFWIGMRGTYCASVPEFVLQMMCALELDECQPVACISTVFWT
jgi:hypothetical protein